MASQSRLISGSDGYFYGTTYWGGSSGFGTVYRMDASGAVTTVHSFAYADGANPAGGLLLASDGRFCGTTSRGGAYDLGVVFCMSPSGGLARLHSFDGEDGREPLAALVEAADGYLYGTTSGGGGHAAGTVFRIDGAGDFELLHSFDRYLDGARPVAGLLQARGGLYGTTSEGGPGNLGTVFRLDVGGSFATVHFFAGAEGKNPAAALIQSNSGDLYGTASHGGTNGAGTVFRIDALDELTAVHSFVWATEGSTPMAPLIQGPDGAFYGTTWTGAGTNESGGVFRMEDSGAVTLLHAFDGTDGTRPLVGLVATGDGGFYGATTSARVPPSYAEEVPGTLFRVDSAGSFETLHRFGWQDGVGLATPLLQAADGYLYGTTVAGGSSNLGTVFRMSLSGDVTFLHSFEGGLDGAGPADLIQASDGEIYGTDRGGSNGLGRVFHMAPSGVTKTLHSFDGNDGASPTGLVQADDGQLYGTARFGGGADSGTLFRIDTSGDFAALFDFDPAANWMAYPNGPLVEINGRFYGTTSEGDGVLPWHLGCVFNASVDSGIAMQFTFEGGEGARPLAPLADADGSLWGTASEGGDFGYGTVFKTIADSYDLDVKHAFNGADGAYPLAALLAAGYLYGTTSSGGPGGRGTIFRVDDSGNLTTLYAFPGVMDGGNPDTPVIQASDGFFYGTAGVIYRLSDAAIAANQVMPTSGPAAGGAALIVIGGGFAANASVAVGGVPGSDVTVLDSTFLHLFTPALGPGTLNDVWLENPDSAPAGVAAIRPKAFFADFLDMPQLDPFHDYVEKIFRKGITAGCGTGRYCPNEPVTRAQMAVFLLKSEHGALHVPPPCAGVFTDVACPSLFGDWIEELASEGITAGCGAGRYCPGDPVTRAQMAVFLLKTKHGPAYLPPPCAGIFGDVDCPSLFGDWIEQLAAEKVTAGCGSGNYCPGSPNTRGQMAAFLAKAFGF